MLLGGPKNLFDPRIHHHLALIAFFAWVGLGSDGLSSSCYGPEEMFLQLGPHRHLAMYLMLAVVGTVFLISASYRQIIELFPTGGGGYLVATKLLGPVPGIISGGALVVDYVLTIAISVAAGCAANFSFLPPEWSRFKLLTKAIVVLSMTGMNMPGVKESVLLLTPIFLGFILRHVTLILFGIFTHSASFGHLFVDTVTDTQVAVGDLGLMGVILISLRAFSL